MLECPVNPVEVVPFSRVAVIQRTQNGNFLEQNFVNWINELKSKGFRKTIEGHLRPRMITRSLTIGVSERLCKCLLVLT